MSGRRLTGTDFLRLHADIVDGGLEPLGRLALRHPAVFRSGRTSTRAEPLPTA